MKLAEIKAELAKNDDSNGADKRLEALRKYIDEMPGQLELTDVDRFEIAKILIQSSPSESGIITSLHKKYTKLLESVKLLNTKNILSQENFDCILSLDSESLKKIIDAGDSLNQNIFTDIVFSELPPSTPSTLQPNEIGINKAQKSKKINAYLIKYLLSINLLSAKIWRQIDSLTKEYELIIELLESLKEKDLLNENNIALIIENMDLFNDPEVNKFIINSPREITQRRLDDVYNTYWINGKDILLAQLFVLDKHEINSNDFNSNFESNSNKVASQDSPPNTTQEQPATQQIENHIKKLKGWSPFKSSSAPKIAILRNLQKVLANENNIESIQNWEAKTIEIDGKTKTYKEIIAAHRNRLFTPSGPTATQTFIENLKSNYNSI